MPKNKPLLPSDRAFVVQLRWDAAVQQGDFRGRIEHLTSMQVAHFASIEELAAFIARIVAAQSKDDE